MIQGSKSITASAFERSRSRPARKRLLTEAGCQGVRFHSRHRCFFFRAPEFIVRQLATTYGWDVYRDGRRWRLDPNRRGCQIVGEGLDPIEQEATLEIYQRFSKIDLD